MKSKNTGKRILCALLTAALALTGAWLLPAGVGGGDTVGDGLARPATAYAATATPKVGDTIYFGRYPQSLVNGSNPTAKPAAGKEGTDWVSQEVNLNIDSYTSYFRDPPSGSTAYYKIEPIAWRILSKPSDQLFLMAEKALDAKPYHTDDENVTWETSTIRSWLNGYGASSNNGDSNGISYISDNFIGRAFNAAEKKAIATTAVQNKNNPKHGTYGGNNTSDKVFLLSYQQAISSSYGFSSSYAEKDPMRWAQTTYFARARHAIGAAGSDVASSCSGNACWWLRSPGVFSDQAAKVDFDGYADYSGNYVTYSNHSVRPALYLNLKSVALTSTGSGKWTAATSDATTATKLKAPTKLTLTAKKKSLLVKWTKPTEAAKQQLTGYKIRYRYKTGKTWSKWKTKTVKVSYKATAKTAKTTVKKLKSGKTYQVQIRSYKITGKGKAKQQYYSKWTKGKKKRVY